MNQDTTLAVFEKLKDMRDSGGCGLHINDAM